MELKMLEVTRKGPVPYHGVAILKAFLPEPGASWTNASATLGRKRLTADGYDEVGDFPLDLGFIPSRVQKGNCRWAGLRGPETVPGSPVRLVDHFTDEDLSTKWALGDDEANPTTTYYYKCDACDLRFSALENADAAHPIQPVIMDTGFGFDRKRKLFVASSKPGTLVVLISDGLKGFFGWGKSPQASFAYAQEYGHMTGRKPVYEGRWDDRYSYAVLQAD
jgi:hypothetical protein